MTKTEFLAQYRATLLTDPECAWAQDETRLNRFMAAVEGTIRTQAMTWNIDSKIAARVWRTSGFKGKPTFRGLRALAE